MVKRKKRGRLGRGRGRGRDKHLILLKDADVLANFLDSDVTLAGDESFCGGVTV